MIDNKQLQQVGEAAWDVVNSLRETNQAVTNRLVAFQDRNLKFAQSVFLNWTEFLENKTETTQNVMWEWGQQVQKPQDSFQRLRIYHPKQVRPDAPRNHELEGLISKVVTHTEKEDLQMRFFGDANVEAIPARITGRKLDQYEQPRDMVIVAFNKETPVGYTDIVEDTFGEQTAEVAILVCSDMQRQGIGEVMIKQAVEETRKKGIRHLKGYIHPLNYKMKQALKKWSEDLHMRMRKKWEAGELAYVIDL